MKSYKEIASNVFERREQYESEQLGRKRALTRALTPIGCVCLAAMLGVGAWHGGLFDAKPSQTAEDALYAGIKDNFDESKGESPDNPAANNKIVINKIDGVPADKHHIALFMDDFVPMDRAQVNEYYGVNIFPTVPEGFEEWDDQVYGVFRRDGGTGEIYWDQMVINYDNEDASKKINMEVKKGSLPVLDYYFGDAKEEKSILNNLEVAIGFSEVSGYHAIFMYKDVGFCINGDGLTQDEFVKMISSIIK